MQVRNLETGEIVETGLSGDDIEFSLIPDLDVGVYQVEDSSGALVWLYRSFGGREVRVPWVIQIPQLGHEPKDVVVNV